MASLSNKSVMTEQFARL